MGTSAKTKLTVLAAASNWRPASVKSLPGYALLPRLYRRLFMPDASVYWDRRVMDRETRELVQGVQPHQLSALELSGDYWGRIEQFKTYRSVHYPEFDVHVGLDRAVRPDLRGASVRAPAVAVPCRKACVSNAPPRRLLSDDHALSGPNSRSAGRLFALDQNRHPILSGRVRLRSGADPDRFLGKYRLRPRQLYSLGSVPALVAFSAQRTQLSLLGVGVCAEVIAPITELCEESPVTPVTKKLIWSVFANGLQVAVA